MDVQRSTSTTILVTGARGFVGSALIALAQEISRDFRLVGVDLDDGDLRNESIVRSLIGRVRPDRIVHLAGILDKGDDDTVLKRQLEHTFAAGANVVRCAAETKIRHIVMAGTIDELGSHGGILGPDTPAEPLSAYGLAKSLLREYAAYWARRSSLRVDWFRPFVVYGPGQTRGQMLLPTAFRAARSGGEAKFTDGIQQRDFIHVEDVAAWILQALQVQLRDCGGRLKIHHLGTGEGVEVRTILQTIASEFPESRFELGAIPRRPDEPLLQVSSKYSSDEIPLDGWQPRYRWRQGIAQTAAWWRTTMA